MSWNIEGIEKHIPILNELLTENDIDIAGFQELQCLQSIEDKINNKCNDYHTIISTKDQQRKAQDRLKDSKKRQHFGTSITCKKYIASTPSISS